VTADGEPARIENGPNILCRECCAVSNHVSGLCRVHRNAAEFRNETKADRLYLAWKRERDGEERRPP
jgi:hypothetical protein